MFNVCTSWEKKLTFWFVRLGSQDCIYVMYKCVIPTLSNNYTSRTTVSKLTFFNVRRMLTEETIIIPIGRKNPSEKRYRL